MEWGREADGVWLGARAPAQPVGIRLVGLVRYVAYAALLVASLMFYVWSRVDVRASAAHLDHATVQLAQLQAEQERLLLELASRRDLGTLGQAGMSLGLVEGVAVVEIPRGRPE
ncbi:MAG: hypothetical protein H6739_19120 [Alphaproteobacteria bacterium]|nr:hypothetical protein [Alphaproteobacteria bacterium]